MYFTALFKTQKKGKKIDFKCEMNDFIEDIKSIESYIEGDVNIIEQLEIDELNYQQKMKTAKEVFSQPSSKKTRDILEGKKLLPAPKPIIPSTTVENPPETVEPKPSRRSKSIVIKTSTPIKTNQNSGTTTPKSFKCSLKVGCDFTTNSFNILKWHMATHQNNTEEEKAKKTPSDKSKKQMNLKTKSSVTKKQELQDKLLKDWIDGDNEDDKVFDSSGVGSATTELLPATNEIDVLPTECMPSTSGVQENNTMSISDKNDGSTPKRSTKFVIDCQNKEWSKEYNLKSCSSSDIKEGNN